MCSFEHNESSANCHQWVHSWELVYSDSYSSRMVSGFLFCLQSSRILELWLKTIKQSLRGGKIKRKWRLRGRVKVVFSRMTTAEYLWLLQFHLEPIPMTFYYKVGERRSAYVLFISNMKHGWLKISLRIRSHRWLFVSCSVCSAPYLPCIQDMNSSPRTPIYRCVAIANNNICVNTILHQIE